MTSLVRRRAARAALVAFALPVLAGVGGGALAQPATPAAGVLPGDPVAIDCGGDGTPVAGAATPVPAAATFTIVGEQSVARYHAHEVLKDVGAQDPVGETRAVIGAVLFDADGRALPCSRFAVDMRTLETDQPRRDNYLRNNTLETDKYPAAIFIVTSVEGLDGPLEEGKEASFRLVGNLEIHGVTRRVAWDATAVKKGDEITGKATTTFHMPDFGITPPKVGPVQSIQDDVQLEIEITARKAA